MKKTKMLGIVFAAALALVLAACVYDGDAFTTLPGEVPGALTATGRTDQTYTNLMSRGGDDYVAARGTEFADVVMTFTFNANGSIASYVTIQNGHGATGLADCSRWTDAENAAGENVYAFLNRLIAEGVTFPVNVAEVNTTGRATYSRAAVLYAANDAAAQLGFGGAPAAGLTAIGSTDQTYTNLMTRAGDDYVAARGTEFANVIMEFTFNANGSIASYNTIQTGHGADGAATCSRWTDAENAAGENVYFFLNRLIAEGVTFPVNVAEVNTTGRATYSRAAVLYAANDAAAQLGFGQ